MREMDYSSESRHPYSTLIPGAAFTSELRPIEFAVYVHCERLLQEGAETLPTVRHIASACSISSGAASTALRTLSEKGLLDYHGMRPRILRGDVYLIECNGLHKIGMSRDAELRIADIEHDMPWPVATICRVRVDEPLAFERELHKSVRDRQVKGDWFKLTSEEVERVAAHMWGAR